jgi:hypothetical protein
MALAIWLGHHELGAHRLVSGASQQALVLATNCFAFTEIVGEAKGVIGVVLHLDEVDGKGLGSARLDEDGPGCVSVDSDDLDVDWVDERPESEDLVIELNG